MNREALFHESTGVYAYPEAANTLRLRLRTGAGDAAACRVFYTERYDYEPEVRSEPMSRYAGDGRFDYYAASIRLKSKRFKYYFRITSRQGEETYLLLDGTADAQPSNTLDGGFFQYPYINTDDVPDSPAWTKGAVFYEIFPDRFRRESNCPVPGLAPWGASPRPDSMFGGDIRGIESKLDYLLELGITAVYLTPIFLSDSNHKYDTVDYYQIDPGLGTVEDMKRFVNRAHARGIRVVLDAVFNHMSDKNAHFRDVAEKGAASPYAGWFFVDEYPVRAEPVTNYETFGTNIANMPRINTDNPDAADYLIGVAEHWTREIDIDGWRLDVSDEVSHRFWKRFRERLRGVKPGLFIIGEVWYRATAWLVGDEFDSVMNYPFRQAALDFAANRSIGPKEFENRIGRYMSYYREDTAHLLLNLLGSHDTPRIRTLCRGDGRRVLLAMTLMMTFPGIPMLYYGDELGMEGKADPDCRGTMPWDGIPARRDTFERCRKLIAARRSSPALSEGLIRFLDAGPNALMYLRQTGGDRALVVVNASDRCVESKFDGGSEGVRAMVDIMDGRRYGMPESGRIGIDVGPAEGRIFLLE